MAAHWPEVRRRGGGGGGGGDRRVSNILALHFCKILSVYYQSDTSCTSTLNYLTLTVGHVTPTVGHVTPTVGHVTPTVGHVTCVYV